MSGVALCQLANKIAIKAGQTKVIKKYNNPAKKKFKKIENIGIYLTACQKLGVRGQDVFENNDLFEAKRMEQVIINLYALSGATQKLKGFPGPFIGVKLAKKNKRQFTKAQLRKARNAVPNSARGAIAHDKGVSIANQIDRNVT